MPKISEYTALTAGQVASGDQLVIVDVSAVATKNITVSALAAGVSGAVNVKAYGALGDGSTDDTSAITSAMTAASTTKATVFFPPGTYVVAPFLIADDGTNQTYAAIQVPSGVSLVGAGRNATIIKLKSSSTTSTSGGVNVAVIKNKLPITGGDANILIRDLTVDGNGANQGSGVHHGVCFTRARGVKLDRVTIKNCRGTNTSGWDESFHQDFILCSDATATDCECLTDDASSSASGFSANGSANVKYVNCEARSMSVSMGFTHYDCTSVQHTNCHAYLNALTGFNCENSQEVIYTGCVAGGVAPTSDVAWPFSAGQNLGNYNGFVINGTTNAVLTGCVAKKNSANGYVFNSSSTAVMDGCIAAHNLYGINVQASCIGLVRFANMIFVSNTNADQDLPSGWLITGRGYTGAVPAIAATTVAVANPFNIDATVHVTGGTVTVIAVGGNATGLIAGSFRVPARSSITLTYTVAPTWKWFLD